MNPNSSPEPRRLRPVFGYVAVAGTLPYLLLKLAWIAGLEIGVTEPGLMTTAVMRSANAFTAAMELVAIVVVLALTHSWGLRVPAWFVVFPMWVGTGLLVPIVISFPAIGADFLMVDTINEGLADWVTPMVYTSFAWQGIVLLVAFALYARVRWPQAFGGAAGSRGVGPIGVTGAVLALAVAVAEFRDVFAGGLRLATTALGVVEALAALSAVVAVALLGARGPHRTVTVLLWTGSATLFASGFWSLFGWLAMSDEVHPLDWILAATGCLAGLLLAFTFFSRVAVPGRDHSVPSAQPVPHTP